MDIPQKIIWLSLFLGICIFFNSGECEAARILFLAPFGSKSHKNFFSGIVNVLAEQGHQITMVSVYNPSKEVPNVREIVLPSESGLHMLSDVFDGNKQSPYNMFTMIAFETPKLCTESLATREVQNLKNEEFDLIMMSLFFNHCYYALVHHFKVPYIYVSPAGLVGGLREMVGQISLPAITENEVLPAMNFPFTVLERAQILMTNSFLNVLFNWILISRMENACREKGLCPPDMPSFQQINMNASLTILNSVKALESPPLPSMPNIINIGGLHCRPSKPLPKDLEDWINGSPDGFIFFSLGSAITPSVMPERYRDILAKVFGSLKQRVLWKWDQETMDKLPPNVRLGKWLPQQDILSHPKLKLFITHGGMLSTLEATYHNCPILGMPVFGDQIHNIDRCVADGWATSLKWDELEENKLRNLIEESIQNKKFKEVVKQRSILMNDWLKSPKEEVLYWVEYVLRHKGAPHMTSPLLRIPTYILYNMDIWAAVIASTLVVLLIAKTCLRKLFSYCCRRKTNAQRKKKQN